ncbi:MAG: response regulator [Polyangiaceae bacterium]|nr:response regulator [Polyangiaceae bacterium]
MVLHASTVGEAPGAKPARILLVEDSTLDAELISESLSHGIGAFELTRVDTLDALRKTLEKRACDVVLADFALVGFDGLAALRMTKQVCPDVPFILVSGAVGEETAIDVLKSGATDYVLKHRLERLPAAVIRAVQEAHERAGRQRAQLAVNLLADVGRTLGSSLDLKVTLPQLANHLVPAIADNCAITLVGTDSSIQRVAVADVDEARALWLAKERPRFLDPNATFGTMGVLRSGLPEVVPLVDDAWRVKHAKSPEMLEFFRTIASNSYIVVPLLHNDRVIGAMSLAYMGSGRSYCVEDLPLAEELARRAVVAIENARLFQEAQDAIRDREQLLAVVSHDLRNPLNTIRMGALALSHDQSAEDDNGRRRLRQLRFILNSVDRMTHLVRSLLDMATIQGGRMYLDHTNEPVDSLLDCVQEMMQPLVDSHQIFLTIVRAEGQPLVVRCDRERILQVFSNFLGNAIRFAPRGTEVTIRIERQGRDLWVSIADQGPGIAEEDLPLIFDRFWRKRHKDGGGTGLGLFIAKGIVEAHGGEVRVESVCGRGSTFSFSIPLQLTQNDMSSERSVMLP